MLPERVAPRSAAVESSVGEARWSPVQLPSSEMEEAIGAKGLFEAWMAYGSLKLSGAGIQKHPEAGSVHNGHQVSCKGWKVGGKKCGTNMLQLKIWIR